MRRLSGYIFDEKVAIARTYLEPQVICRLCLLLSLLLGLLPARVPWPPLALLGSRPGNRSIRAA